LKKKFYVTTPIYYVNDKPHIGHAYTTILADVLARYHRLAGDEVFFLTGVDEHGQKVQQAAEKRGVSPQRHCDEFAPRFSELWKKLNISNSDFIRTTQERHKRIVQAVLQKLYDSKEIYFDEYEGWYSVAEERFITDTEKESGQFHDVKKLKEKNYFFKMSKYQKKIIEYIEKNPDYIQPLPRRNEIFGFLKQPLGDLCISRPKARLSWGIEIPFDKDYVTYVWFDALINYVSGIGYLSDEKEFKKWWPADVHLIGKDILTTHSVYWSTMLMAMGLPLPKTIFAHGWWLMGETKMSKSLGNVVNPLDLVDQYGVDAVRYYLMREMVLGDDANFTLDNFIKRYNSDLANDFGNLLNRVSGLINKNFDGYIPDPDISKKDRFTIPMVQDIYENKFLIHLRHLRLDALIEEIMKIIRNVNAVLEKAAPWKLVKTDPNEAGRVLYFAAEQLRFCSVWLSPIMPSKTKTVLEILDAVGSGSGPGRRVLVGKKLKSHEALFPRIEMEKKK